MNELVNHDIARSQKAFRATDFQERRTGGAPTTDGQCDNVRLFHLQRSNDRRFGCLGVAFRSATARASCQVAIGPRAQRQSAYLNSNPAGFHAAHAEPARGRASAFVEAVSISTSLRYASTARVPTPNRATCNPHAADSQMAVPTADDFASQRSNPCNQPWPVTSNYSRPSQPEAALLRS